MTLELFMIYAGIVAFIILPYILGYSLKHKLSLVVLLASILSLIFIDYKGFDRIFIYQLLATIIFFVGILSGWFDGKIKETVRSYEPTGNDSLNL